MSSRAHGQVRRSQVITTWGPGALIDLPRYSGIVGGLETWPKVDALEEIVDIRLTQKIALMTGVPAPSLFAPPPDSAAPGEPKLGIGVWRFPAWMIVQEESSGDGRERARRLVHRRALNEKGTFEGRPVVPTRFVRACPRGHIADLDWQRFVHGRDSTCRRQLWLDERGTGGDLADLVVRCECGKSRGMHEAAAARPEAPRHMPRLSAMAGPRQQAGVQSAEPAADPHGCKRILPPGYERPVPA